MLIVVSLKMIYSAHVYARGRKQCCKLRYCLGRVLIKPTPLFSIFNAHLFCANICDVPSIFTN